MIYADIYWPIEIGRLPFARSGPAFQTDVVKNEKSTRAYPSESSIESTLQEPTVQNVKPPIEESVLEVNRDNRNIGHLPNHHTPVNEIILILHVVIDISARISNRLVSVPFTNQIKCRSVSFSVYYPEKTKSRNERTYLVKLCTILCTTEKVLLDSAANGAV